MEVFSDNRFLFFQKGTKRNTNNKENEFKQTLVDVKNIDGDLDGLDMT